MTQSAIDNGLEALRANGTEDLLAALGQTRTGPAGGLLLQAAGFFLGGGIRVTAGGLAHRIRGTAPQAPLSPGG